MRTVHAVLWLIVVGLSLSVSLYAADSVNVTITYVSTGKSYTVGTALPNELIYIDRPFGSETDGYRFLPDNKHTDPQYSLANTAPVLYGTQFIRCANDDKQLSDVARHLEFTIDKPCTIYLAMDKRANYIPAWLQDGSWFLTGYTVSWGTPDADEVLDAGCPMLVYAKDYSAGSVTLGSNHTNGPTSAPDTHYIPFIVPLPPKYSGGSGTDSDPYQIKTITDWQEFMNTSTDWDKSFILMNHIDLAGLSETEYRPIGDYYSVSFNGVFHGNNHVIRNFHFKREGNGLTEIVGLFGSTGTEAIIENLGVEDFQLSSNHDFVGGLVGINSGLINSCYTIGKTTGVGHSGGLVGWNEGTILNCSSSGEITGSGTFGGLVGTNYYGKIENSNCSSTISGTGSSSIGGLVGGNMGIITSCYSTGSVSGPDVAGGLCGTNTFGSDFNKDSGIIIDCYATGTVTGTDYVGALCGKTSSGTTITNCYATGSVHGTTYVGGLVGKNGEWDNPGGEISNCYATGTVSGDGGVGGLMGWNSGMISRCYATGSAEGIESIGGLAGYNLGIIADCYATGPATGSDRYIGGLVGWNDWGSIASSFSVGLVTGVNSVGGLVGWNYSGTISGFWDTQTSGQPASDGGTGKTTAQMKTLSTFTDAGWDFVGETANGMEDTWKMPYDGYPLLSWQSYVEPGVNFADANLKAAVEAKLGVTNPTEDDMLKLTYLDARTRGITSLIGLETALNLTTLYLNQNAVSDLAPVAGLTKLTALSLYSNKIEDLTPLSGLTKLYYLVLSVNKISDISPLSGLPNLMYLYINNNQISDFSPITTQTKFKEIYANRNAILTKETYLTQIPAIRANNPNLRVFQYDPGCQTALLGDLTQDCRVNLADLAAMAENWLKCNHIYPEMCP